MAAAFSRTPRKVRGRPTIVPPPLRYHAQAEKILENEACRRRRRRPARSPPARAQEANVTLYGRINVDMEFVNGKQAGSGCPEQCPNPNVFRVNSNSSEFGIRGTEPLSGGVSAIFQIENSMSVTARPRRPHRPRLLRRLARAARHLQDGLLPRALRRHPADLRQRPDADELDPVDGVAVGPGLSGSAGVRRLRRPPAAIDPLRHADDVRPECERPVRELRGAGASPQQRHQHRRLLHQRSGPARRRLRISRPDPRHAGRAAVRSRVSRWRAATSSRRFASAPSTSD